MESWVLLTPSQYGFRNAHSAQHAIPDIVNAIRTNMNNRLFSCGIFIDLKKAFDTADHEILLRKSDHYGFRGINVSRTVGLIVKLRHFLPTHTLLNIYQALIAPYLTYGLTVWGQACESYLDKLLKLQKRAHRFIYFSDHNEHAIPLFDNAHILTLKFVHYESLANLMFDVWNRTAPSNIQDLFQDIYNVHSYNILPLPLITSIPNLLGYPFKQIPSLGKE